MPDALDTDKLRELLEKATPGPWESRGGDFWQASEYPVRLVCGDAHGDDQHSNLTQEDCALIVALRNAAPALLALAARAERMEAALREIAVQGCESPHDELCPDCAPEDRSGWCDRCLAQDGLNKAALPAADRRAENDKHE